VPADSLVAQEETFVGRSRRSSRSTTLEHAIELTNASPYGLLSAIFTRDLSKVCGTPTRLRTGWVNINESSNYWEPHLPFGGRAGTASGIGRVGGRGRWRASPNCRRSWWRDLRLRDRRRRVGGVCPSRTDSARSVDERARARGWAHGFLVGPVRAHAAALSFPIGNRFYDWKYESEPEPQMNGRRVYHARGKLLGGSSSINGMIFQRGNPLDYERWAGEPGLEHWDYAHCLPYFKRLETCFAGADDWRGRQWPVSRSSAARLPGRSSARSSTPYREGGLRADRRRGTATRQEGLRPFRPDDPQGQARQRGARVPASGEEPAEPRGAHAHLRRPPSSSRERAQLECESGRRRSAPAR